MHSSPYNPQLCLHVLIHMWYVPDSSKSLCLGHGQSPHVKLHTADTKSVSLVLQHAHDHLKALLDTVSLVCLPPMAGSNPVIKHCDISAVIHFLSLQSSMNITSSSTRLLRQGCMAQPFPGHDCVISVTSGCPSFMTTSRKFQKTSKWISSGCLGEYSLLILTPLLTLVIVLTTKNAINLLQVEFLLPFWSQLHILSHDCQVILYSFYHCINSLVQLRTPIIAGL